MRVFHLANAEYLLGLTGMKILAPCIYGTRHDNVVGLRRACDESVSEYTHLSCKKGRCHFIAMHSVHKPNFTLANYFWIVIASYLHTLTTVSTFLHFFMWMLVCF